MNDSVVPRLRKRFANILDELQREGHECIECDVGEDVLVIFSYELQEAWILRENVWHPRDQGAEEKQEITIEATRVAEITSVTHHKVDEEKFAR